jgi:rhodanese-related sulfurtransferase
LEAAGENVSVSLERSVPSPTALSGYAGDIEPNAAWALLSGNPKAQLVDVRTAAEWTFVGLPDLAGIGREVLRVEWQSFPSMAINGAFADEAAGRLAQAGAGADTPVLFLCRSGARSRAAAIAMTKAGFTQAYNLVGGFEGDLDSDHHRGRTNGWKAAGLPWKQT